VLLVTNAEDIAQARLDTTRPVTKQGSLDLFTVRNSVVQSDSRDTFERLAISDSTRDPYWRIFSAKLEPKLCIGKHREQGGEHEWFVVRTSCHSDEVGRVTCQRCDLAVLDPRDWRKTEGAENLT